jgi:hypothetical protein
MALLLHSLFLLLAASEDAETFTVFAFSRKINTCDPADRPLEEATSKIIWAYNDNDPGPDGVPKHQNMGSQSVRFFSQNELPPLPSDAVAVDVTVGGETLITFDSPNFPIGTNYWCSSHKVTAPNLFDTKKHLIRFEPIIDPRYIKQVHHIVVYICQTLTEEELQFSQSCYDATMPTGVEHCFRTEVLAGWAVGGDTFDYPPEAGMPFGPTDAIYLLMVIHYDNPTLIPIYDNSGFRYWFTSQLREYEAGIGSYAHIVQPQFVIPKGQAEYKYEAWVPPLCTNNYPAEGITLLAVSLHTHLIGTAGRLQQFRNGVELQPILEEPYYDFNYQDYVKFNNRTTRVLPGDTLRLECTYNSFYRNVDTPMGEATSEEMCLVYFIYYPKLASAGAWYADYGAQSPSGKVAFCGGQPHPQINVPNLTDLVPYVPPPCPYEAPDPTKMILKPRNSLINPNDYSKSVYLDSDQKIKFYWTIDRVGLMLHAAIEAKTRGWVGFGISAFGMEGADVTIGWVDDNNTLHFADRFAVRKAEPPIDILQDYYDVSGGQITLDNSSSSLLTRTQLYLVGAGSGALIVLVVIGAYYCYQRRKSAPFSKLITEDPHESIPI